MRLNHRRLKPKAAQTFQSIKHIRVGGIAANGAAII